MISPANSQLAIQGGRCELTWKLNILLVNKDLVAFRSELLLGKEVDGASGLGQPDKLGSVQSCGVVQYTRTIDDGDSLVFAE